MFRDLSRELVCKVNALTNVLLSRFCAFVLKLLAQLASPVSAGSYDPRAILALQLRQKLLINVRYARNK